MLEKFSTDTIEAIFNTLPVDLTFVDNTDTVRYYSRGDERIFRRTPAVIGRKVQECHSEASVPMVNQVISDLKSGKRQVVEAWKDRNGRKVYYRYFPVKDKTGKYLGILEFVQDITDIQKLTGEKKGLDEG